MRIFNLFLKWGLVGVDHRFHENFARFSSMIFRFENPFIVMLCGCAFHVR